MQSTKLAAHIAVFLALKQTLQHRKRQDNLTSHDILSPQFVVQSTLKPHGCCTTRAAASNTQSQGKVGVLQLPEAAVRRPFQSF